MTITARMTGRRTLLATTAIVASAILAACSSSSSGGGSGSSGSPASPAASSQNSASGGATVGQADIDKAMSTPTTLTFWTWVPNIDKEVAVFEKQYPAIKIKVVNAGQGLDQYTKLRTALKAGSGTPDLAQIEYQYVPTFSITKSLVDLRPYGAEANASKFVPWTWGQVTGSNGEIWAYPQDTGPMGLLYRADIFKQYGLTVPTTWDEFTADAKKLHAANPKVYFTNLANNEPAAYHGLLWQAGSKPYTVNGTTVGIAVNDSQSKAVATYWSGLINQGLVSTDPDFTDQWYQGLNSGKYATWITAAWGPVFLTGTAKSTAGKWRAAPLPQTDPSNPTSGNWGGSTTAVIAGTKNPIAASQFALFLNTNAETTKMFNTVQNFFPATTALLADSSFADQKSDFFGGQQVNKLFAQISTTVNKDFQWPPFLDQSYTIWNDNVGKAFANKADAVAATETWQSKLVDYAKAQGFTVSGS